MATSKKKSGTSKKTTSKTRPAGKPKSRAKTASKAKPDKLTARQMAAKKKLETYVRTVSRDIDKVEREGRKALQKAEAQYKITLATIKADRAKLEKQMRSLAGKGEHAFDDVKKGVEAAYKDLSLAARKAYRRFT